MDCVTVASSRHQFCGVLRENCRISAALIGVPKAHLGKSSSRTLENPSHTRETPGEFPELVDGKFVINRLGGSLSLKLSKSHGSFRIIDVDRELPFILREPIAIISRFHIVRQGLTKIIDARRIQTAMFDQLSNLLPFLVADNPMRLRFWKVGNVLDKSAQGCF